MTKHEQTLTTLIRNEFDKVNRYWQGQERKELIQTAKHYGFNDLANEMTNDLK